MDRPGPGRVASRAREVSSRFTPYWLVVAYREVSSSDGFVITGFFTRRIGRVEGRRLVWKRESS